MFNQAEADRRQLAVTQYGKNVPPGHTNCPMCGQSDDIQTSAYTEADYFCNHCWVWFMKDEVYSPLGDALARLDD